MVGARRFPFVVTAIALVAVVTLAACSGGGSGHRARGSRATTTTSSTAPSSTTTTLRPSSTTVAPSTTAPTAPNGTTPSTARPGSVPSPLANCIAETPQELTSYLGRSLGDAQALAASQGYHVRVVGSDGKCATVSTELDPNRVDVYLDKGIVTAAGMG